MFVHVDFFCFFSNTNTKYTNKKPSPSASMGEQDKDNDPEKAKSANLSGEGLPMNTTSEDWHNDPRIAFNQTSQKWIFEDTENGLEYEYDETQGDWVPVVNDAAISLQQQAYVKEDEETVSISERGSGDTRLKRKSDSNDVDEEKYKKEMEELVSLSGSKSASKSAKKAKVQKQEPIEDTNKFDEVPYKPRINRGIYLWNLPKDTTHAELDIVFSKYGIIAEDLRAKARGKKGPTSKRIKIYTDIDNKPKGDGVIVYFKQESVDLAVQMMDRAELRPGHPDSVIRVESASYNHKGEAHTAEPTETARPPVEVPKIDKKTLIKQYQKMNEKLADWDADDDAAKAAAAASASKRWEKVVILKNVFTLDDLKDDKHAAADIKADIVGGCEAIGMVTNVIMYDAEPSGVVSVKFQHKDDALECVKRMHGRFFGGHRLDAAIYDGLEHYKRTPKQGANEDDVEKDENKRLEDFGNWLESQT